MGDSRLACVRCGRAVPLASANVRCNDCDEPFEVQSRPGIVPRDCFTELPARTIFEQYAPFYPFLSVDPILSLGEGRTSLLRSQRVGREIGLDNLFFKNETENPTWTFKDRGTACSIQHAARSGFTRVGTLSSGNMGASVAAFGRRAGMETFILLRAGVPPEKIDAIAVYQVNVVVVSGGEGDIYDKALEAGRALGIYFSLADEPLRVEGYKSVAFEIFAQMGPRVPDFVAVPVGSGGLCRGVLKGFKELQSTGFADRVPTLVGVQSEGCSPIADAFARGSDRIDRFPSPSTLDHVLENPTPPSGNELLRRMRADGGIVAKVSNQAIIDAALLLAREGIFAQPAAATALAGVVECARRGQIPADAQVVSVVTGTGLKYSSVLQAYGLTSSHTTADELTTRLSELIRP